MKVHQLNQEHYKALFDFETRNKEWFELFVPPRPRAYQTLVGFSCASDALLREQDSGASYFYVGYLGDTIIARANLTELSNGVGSIGYRVCRNQTGKGYGSAALNYLIDVAKHKLGLKELNAKTTTNNIASMKVLEKQGFSETVRETNTFNMNGEEVSFVHYVKHLE
ncbi:GNAT family N-acetyltransferase [Vibrio hippocampi]|uniref:N-acetyltransferase domain-containing protein n=1 Tax=Vibrio hippocampi TaxID=654686 RepID=A0ABM8ZF40_9VIBR|nr:GNAT family protein [Vibrio hippocampi]CAH0525137.1 hypothetical protein VHP8226_00803 [Vibrio hippocampi]